MGLPPGYTARVLRTISSSKASRHIRAALRRKNEFDPVLERGARYDTTRIPVREVNREWWHNALSGRRAHLRIGIYYEIFQQLLQCSPYTPIGNFTVTYPPIGYKQSNAESADHPAEVEQMPVLLGNTILPKSAAVQPNVDIDWSLFNTEYASVFLTNPDGYLIDTQYEILHWLVTNIPRGKSLVDGQVMKEYMRPLPFYGTGLHRFVFFLIEHNKPITYTHTQASSPSPPISKFEERIFQTSKFLSDNQIVPSECVSFRLFQSMWDTSVSTYLIEELKIAEPYYKFDVPLTRGQIKHNKIREVRSNKFRIK
ncbi:39S ribosomal protein L38, mitochondrial-like [Oopsacas minuta]|uniref:Large ribosomal subunit protein mL38 n=1 Tax=Oopsacas minuta TaxID=111878 RepID=A0AAV7K7M1_9METZ|nr:39S ribosomal protein L38, mitochondrial-like [Oopsacas minuta]